MQRLLKYMELHDVSYGIEYVARPLLLFFSSENQLLWFRYREYDLAHLKLVFEFSIYNVWKSVQYGVSNGLDTAYWGFLGARIRRIFLMDTAYWSSEYNKRAKHALDSFYLWHCHLGHINKKRMDKLQRDGILQLTHDESLEKCKPCISGKMARKPFPHYVERAKDLLGLIHTDVCGPFRTVLREGASYFITFTDDFSRYGYVYLMKHKHEVFETFKVFHNEVENQLGKKIKVIRSDRGGEYLSHEFVNHMKSYGIVSQLTPPYTPQHNGVSERKNRTLLDMVRSMMNPTTLPKSFWGYALESATRILNMVPIKKVKRTPPEIWHGKAPKLSYLRVWGYEALVKRYTPDKLDPRSIKCIFVGYPKETVGYYFYYPLENKIFIARNVEFFENSLMVQEASGSHGLLKSSGSDGGLELIQEEDTQTLKILVKIPQALDRYDFYVDVKEYELGDLNEPPNYKAALSDPEFDKWLEALNTEMQSMKDNQV
ncbi:retrotransposon protein, putative, ty1-copia subclass [Tanacetum coccineum]|uniref:Retrotransposon protein, putative, ty1-copia subclass n=2 Tax=Tanacetum coccineum TaxID=301880 RepID=A0ABQ5AJ86_9ASTR